MIELDVGESSNLPLVDVLWLYKNRVLKCHCSMLNAPRKELLHELTNKLNSFVSLPSKHSYIAKLFFGIGFPQQLTTGNIAIVCNISRQRVHQIISKSVKYLEFKDSPGTIKSIIKSNIHLCENCKTVKRLFKSVIYNEYTMCYLRKERLVFSYSGFYYLRTQDYAHRVAYKVFVGDLGKLQVLHKCDTPNCINPQHLFLGTRADNCYDRHKKGRTVSGHETNYIFLRGHKVKKHPTKDWAVVPV